MQFKRVISFLEKELNLLIRHWGKTDKVKKVNLNEQCGENPRCRASEQLQKL